MKQSGVIRKYNTIDVEEFGDTTRDQVDLCVLLTHSESSTAFLRRVIPELYSYVHPNDRPFLTQYENIEQDAGSEALARVVINSLLQRLEGKIRIRLIKQKTHRAYIDGNRVRTWDGLRGFTQFSGESHLNAMILHRLTVEETKEAIGEPRMFWDCHTMNRESPGVQASGCKAINDVPGQMKGYVVSALNGIAMGGSQRPVCLIDSVSDGNGGLQAFYDDAALAQVETGFMRGGVQVGRNNPYSAGHGQLMAVVIADSAGIMLVTDIPKAYLTSANHQEWLKRHEEAVSGSAKGVIESHIDPWAVQRMAAPIADGLFTTMNTLDNQLAWQHKNGSRGRI